jgi:AmpD protein
MHLSIDDAGWLSGARHCPSPNFNARPLGAQPELVVIHNISLPAGQFGGPHIDALFTNCLDCAADDSFAPLVDLQVSAHALIRRDGELVQYVSFAERAWHAGVSCWNGRENCNDFSVGIELEGADLTPFTEAQYARLDALLRQLLARYPTLSREAITGHSNIAPGRKTDPGPAFDWARLKRQLEIPREA